MSLLDPELFDRRDPHQPYDMHLQAPMEAPHGTLTTTFGFLISSCQKQLGERQADELQYAVEFVNWLMREANHRFTHDFINANKDDNEVHFYTDPRQILAFFEDFDLEDQEGFPNATPEDYFAVLSLAKCFEALETHERITAFETGKSGTIVQGYPEDLQDSLYHTAISARDSLLQEAKDLIAFIDGIKFAQLRARNAGKRGAAAKSTRFAMLRDKLMAAYDQHYQKMTNRQAANRLYQEFREEVDKELRTDDPANRLAIWIGQHKKKTFQN